MSLGHFFAGVFSSFSFAGTDAATDFIVFPVAVAVAVVVIVTDFSGVEIESVAIGVVVTSGGIVAVITASF